MTRYTPSRHYLTAGLAAFLLGAASAWLGYHWAPSIVPAVLSALTGAVCIFLHLRPAVEIHPHHVRIGSSVIPWADIQAVDRTGWISPLVVLLTLTDGSRRILIYPGDLESSHSLMRQLRRCAREALIDGLPYHEFWGDGAVEVPFEALPEARTRKQLPASRYPVLREEDEADVERLYQRLKAVGHLDSKDEN